MKQQQQVGFTRAQRDGGAGGGDEGDAQREHDGGSDGNSDHELEAAAFVAGSKAYPAVDGVI